MVKISLISVNYNTEEYIAKLIDNLKAQTMNPLNFEFIVVNNCQNSKLEDTISNIKCDFVIRVIQSPENIGFGRGNNLGAQSAMGEYLLIINPDITIVNADYLEQLYKFSKENPEYGIVSTRVVEQNGVDSCPSYSYAYNINFNLPGKIASVIGALMMVKKALFDEVNGFDPDYFLYDEETDLCLRIRQQGFSIYSMDNLCVRHIGGVSEVNKYKYEYWVKKQRGIYLFCLKHYPKELFIKILKNDIALYRRKKIISWIKVYIFKTNSKMEKYEQRSAIYDCAKRTLKSTQWLYYR